MSSLSGVLTWVTMLSSTQRMEMGTLAPHLFQRAVIPHLTAIIPVRLEPGLITLAFASMIGPDDDDSDSDSKEQKPLHRNWLAKLAPPPPPWKREMRHLDRANIFYCENADGFYMMMITQGSKKEG